MGVPPFISHKAVTALVPSPLIESLKQIRESGDPLQVEENNLVDEGPMTSAPLLTRERSSCLMIVMKMIRLFLQMFR